MRVRLAPRGQLTLRSEPIFPLYFKQPLIELAHQLLDRLILGGTRFGPAFAVAPPPLSDDERQEQEGNEPEDELVRYAAGKPCRGVVIAVDGTPPNKEAVLAQPRRAGRARNTPKAFIARQTGRHGRCCDVADRSVAASPTRRRSGTTSVRNACLKRSETNSRKRTKWNVISTCKGRTNNGAYPSGRTVRHGSFNFLLSRRSPRESLLVGAKFGRR